VYVYLRNPKATARPAYYVGMTGLRPSSASRISKQGVKAGGVVTRAASGSYPLYAHLNPMPYVKAAKMEVAARR